jgi:hypothetical protein
MNEHYMIILFTTILVLLSYNTFKTCDKCKQKESFAREHNQKQGEGYMCISNSECLYGLTCQEGFCQTTIRA